MKKSGWAPAFAGGLSTRRKFSGTSTLATRDGSKACLPEESRRDKTSRLIGRPFVSKEARRPLAFSIGSSKIVLGAPAAMISPTSEQPRQEASTFPRRRENLLSA